MNHGRGVFNSRLLCGAAMLTLASFAGAAHAEKTTTYTIAPQPLESALREFGKQSGLGILANTKLTGAKTTHGVMEASDPETALERLLVGTGLTYRRNGDVFAIVTARNDASARSVGTPFATAAETVSGSAVEGLVVTAQKRREQIQDVPIAISAFSADALQAQKIEGGFDLLKAIPNVTFSKNNFSGYNFSIRGIGTKAISVTTDPGVAVEFNSTALIRNRLFEQEYFDVQRVEVLRGPQGTLHGRNATAGVINVISNTAELDAFDGSLKGEVGNYHTKRLSGFINIPVIEDVLAVRFAGALTSRDGYDYNATTKNAVNGRDLWSGRLSIGFEPTEKLRADFIWERFNEDDDRSRTGKQLCHHDSGLSRVGDNTLQEVFGSALTSQGCKMGSLYDPQAFGTPNGLSIPFIYLAGFKGDPNGQIGWSEQCCDADTQIVTALNRVDPYGGMMQSPDLRVINSFRDPIYRARTDLLELNFSMDVSPTLAVTSQTAYTEDEVYSFQDYNRFNTVPIFPDTSGLWDGLRFGCPGQDFTVCEGPSRFRTLSPGGIYCDPQLGCSNSLAGFDISQARSSQFSQEVRVASNYDGPFNFSAGVNYTDYRTLEDYYVMFNIITLLAQIPGGEIFPLFNNSPDITKCGSVGGINALTAVQAKNVDPVDINSPEAAGCVYIDPNPIESINGDGHNYFRSKNPYKLKSAAAFGEAYWQVMEDLKLTAGLRYTDDRKTFTPVPTQVLMSRRVFLGGTVDRGYPSLPNIKQHWGEVTGRVGVDWKPDLPFTDDTMVYAFYSRGYKGGGANPPGIGYSTEPVCLFSLCTDSLVQPIPYPKVFESEFVNAFEMGAKNTLFGGAMTMNLGAFFYDYRNYQVSQIKDRTAVNENFDAKVWGLEFESLFAPTENLRINASIGYQDTEIADGMESIDLMDRTAGNTDYAVMKPFIIQPSNCIVPKKVIENVLDTMTGQGQQNPDAALIFLCPGNFFSEAFGPALFGDVFSGSGVTREEWLATTNNGAGFMKELGGNELPNAPHYTISLGAQYGWDLLDGTWRANVRTDAYWQSQSWARVYNDNPYDKLHGWYNANLSFWLEKPEADLKIEFYVKNALNDTPITDAFLNSDDTALTTNVFVLDPRLIGLQITKGF